jgi:hypothetical protein
MPSGLQKALNGCGLCLFRRRPIRARRFQRHLQDGKARRRRSECRQQQEQRL